jgi:DNA-binding response OmpR family regulator
MARREFPATVLIVEDEPLVAMHMAAMLTELGFSDIRFAHSVANGLALMSWTLALGVLDVNLGGRPVFPLAEALRAQRVPLVFSTGQWPRVLPLEWANYPLLPKPLEPKALASAIKALGLI